MNAQRIDQIRHHHLQRPRLVDLEGRSKHLRAPLGDPPSAKNAKKYYWDHLQRQTVVGFALYALGDHLRAGRTLDIQGPPEMVEALTACLHWLRDNAQVQVLPWEAEAQYPEPDDGE